MIGTVSGKWLGSSGDPVGPPAHAQKPRVTVIGPQAQVRGRFPLVGPQAPASAHQRSGASAAEWMVTTTKTVCEHCCSFGIVSSLTYFSEFQRMCNMNARIGARALRGTACDL